MRSCSGDMENARITAWSFPAAPAVTVPFNSPKMITFPLAVTRAPSVSYTHLDVYKRQIILTAGIKYFYLGKNRISLVDIEYTL